MRRRHGRADPSFFDSEGKTPLMHAAAVGHAQVVRCLLDAGAPWNALSPSNVSAGDLAMENAHQEAFDVLLNFAIQAELVLGTIARGGRDGEGSASQEVYLSERVAFGEDRIVDAESKAVMMAWEKPLMEAHARAICCFGDVGGKILNVGFGMGLVDEAIQRYKPLEHTIVEAHPEVYDRMIKSGWGEKENVKIVFGKWQDVLPQLGSFDGIFFDTYGDYYDDMREFHQHLHRLLKPGTSRSCAIMEDCFVENTPNPDTVEEKRICEPALSKMPSNIAQIRLVSQHPEVYDPYDDSFVLVDALLADRANILNLQPRFCLEVGSGSGYVIASLAIMLHQQSSGIQYFTTDINPHAAETTASTLEAHGVHAEIICTDLASGLEKRLAGMLDLIIVNPPNVPSPDEEVGCEGYTSSWAGGENGRKVIDRILPIAHNLLSEKGWLYMVIVTPNNPFEICLMMRKMGYESRIVVQRSTDEEIFLIIKFWREITEAQSCMSWISHLPLLSFWRSCVLG